MADNRPPHGDAGTALHAADAHAADAADADARDASPSAPAFGLADTPKANSGLGGIIGAILRGLQPAVRKATHRSSRRGSTTTSRSSAGSGTLLQVHYHDGSTTRWATARVAYGRRGNRIAVISSSDAQWWRHVRNGSAVQVRVRNQWVDGHARVVSRDEETYARAVGIFIEDRSRAAAQRLGVPMDQHGKLDRGERRTGEAVVVWIEVEGT